MSEPSGHTADVPLRELLDQRTTFIQSDLNVARIDLERRIDEARRVFNQLLDERDRLYMTRFEASTVAVTAALAAQEKAVSAAFLASEKAIIKAEDAQREYNIRSNEFRGQLDDQAKMLMPRNETLTMFKAIEDKVGGIHKTFDDKAAQVQIQISDLQAGKAEQRAFNDRTTLMQNQINDLNLSKAALEGKASNSSVMTAYIIAVCSLAIGIVSIVIRFF